MWLFRRTCIANAAFAGYAGSVFRRMMQNILFEIYKSPEIHYEFRDFVMLLRDARKNTWLIAKNTSHVF